MAAFETKVTPPPIEPQLIRFNFVVRWVVAVLILNYPIKELNCEFGRIKMACGNLPSPISNTKKCFSFGKTGIVWWHPIRMSCSAIKSHADECSMWNNETWAHAQLLKAGHWKRIATEKRSCEQRCAYAVRGQNWYVINPDHEIDTSQNNGFVALANTAIATKAVQHSWTVKRRAHHYMFTLSFSAQHFSDHSFENIEINWKGQQWKKNPRTQNSHSKTQLFDWLQTKNERSKAKQKAVCENMKNEEKNKVTEK